MILEEQFIQIVEAELDSRKWSRSDLARAMGVSRQYVTNYLNRRSSPGSDVMERFLAALDLQPRLSVSRTPVPRKAQPA